MSSDFWQWLLTGALALNGALGFGYRVYRLSKGGPMGDVVGQAILGATLAALAVSVASGAGWARWLALGYGLLFGAAVMPVWTLAVLIPLRPRWPDYTFTIVYCGALAAIVVAAIAL
jgi:hypothetical protein